MALTKKPNTSSWILEAIQRGDLSLNERMDLVRRAISQKFNQGPGDYCYPEVVFDDYAIVSKAQKLWRVELNWGADGTVTIDGDAKQVRVAYPTVNQEATRFEGQVFGPMADSDQVQEGVAPAMTGKRWGVLIIQEGLSKNRNNYGRKVLQEASPLYEGARIYLDHQETPRKFGRSVHDQAGFLKDVKPALLNTSTQEAEGAAPIFALAATAVITKASVRQEMLEAYEEGNPNLFGLSHDAMCRSVTTMDAGQRPFYNVTKIESVSSVDLVTNAAAGGRVLRLVASDTEAHTLEGDGAMLKKLIDSIKGTGNAALIAKLEALGDTPNEDQLMAIYSEAASGTPTPSAQRTEAVATPAAAASAATVTPAVQVTEAVAESRRNTEAIAELKAENIRMFLNEALNGCALMPEVKDQIKARFMPAIAVKDGLPTREAITDAIKESVDLFAKLAENKRITMPSAAGFSRIEVGTRRDKVVEALDDFFGVKKDDTVRGGFKVVEAKSQMSFRNLYAEITGDTKVTGRLSEATRLSEALDSTTFGEILGDSITRRMVADYATGSQAQWRGVIADVVPVSDFRTQRRMRFGGYGNLSLVPQGAAYPTMTSPTDEEATYSPAKRGGTEQITLEMVTNDDVGAIRRIPQKMARAASQTLYEFVFDFMRTNAAIYDSTALAAAGHGNNITTSALSNTQLGVLRLAIKNQTDMSNGKKLGIPSRYLFVPSELEELAFWLTKASAALPDSSIPGTAMSGAPNFQAKLGIQPITVDYWTDVNNYWLTSSVQDTPMIEIGFLGGREEPELFIQDQPNVGSMFSNDVITYKVRHVYGGAVLDYRGFAGGIVP